MWNIGRDALNGGFDRRFDKYLECFYELLTLDTPMHLFIPSEIWPEVERIRGDKPTTITIKEVATFQTWFPFYNLVQHIRSDPDWLARAGWLADSPQAALPDYNPILMAKAFMVHDACLLDRRGCTHFYWLDGGILNTVNKGALEQAIPRLPDYSGDQLALVSYPYESATEVHGFEAKAFDNWCGEKSTYVCRGGFFGGCRDVLGHFNHSYYHFLQDTLNDGLMGADENIITIFSHRHSDKVKRHELKPENHGLLGSFFESVAKQPIAETREPGSALYVLTYNAPDQLQALLESFDQVDPDFLTLTRRILIDNSTDAKVRGDYDQLVDRYKFEVIRQGNIGVCGGRQLAAEHFGASNQQQYLYFEDDMLLSPTSAKPDAFGLPRHVPGLFLKSLRLFKDSGLDFLKLSFSEFYGSNDECWAWTNLPADLRAEWFPDQQEVDPKNVRQTAPRTRFTSIFRNPSLPGLAALLGEVHYCNWPCWFDRVGNKKVFLDTRWASPREQTWMSACFQLQRAGKVHAGVLLASPVAHNRFHHYPADQRKES
jgi:hypothetical protein